ncbi:MAG: hypothetical protein MZV64_49315 [Ignavibacteriales bacterium]|nr:hypothetical protein [Ignavibacteriales bacterium]
MAGAGLPEEFAGWFLEGDEQRGPGGRGPARPDQRSWATSRTRSTCPSGATRARRSPSTSRISASSSTPTPTPSTTTSTSSSCPIPTRSAGRPRSAVVTHVTHNTGGANEKFNFSPGLAPNVDPPGGLSGTCSSPNDYDGGTISFINVKEYWLDVTGQLPRADGGRRRLHRRRRGRRPLLHPQRRPLPPGPQHRELPARVQRRHGQRPPARRLVALAGDLDRRRGRPDPAGPDVGPRPDGPGLHLDRQRGRPWRRPDLPPAGPVQQPGRGGRRPAPEVPARVDVQRPEHEPQPLQPRPAMRSAP